jgi:RNA polymerase sigma-70 factor (ECF subfamily)
MNVIRVRATYAPTAKFATWLYTLAHNRLVDHWRSTAQATFVSTDDAADETARDAVAALPAARTDRPDVRAGNRQLSARMNAALAGLPPAQRDAFLLQQEGGLSLAEIATLTGAGAETVKSRLRYAIAKLRLELGDWRDQA